MELTREILDTFVGGQLEVANVTERYLYRGEIATIELDGEGTNSTLRVTLRWCAKGEGYPTPTGRWISDDDLNYSADLFIYTVSDIGDQRVMLNSIITLETAVLHPKGGDALDPTKVEGLKLTA